MTFLEKNLPAIIELKGEIDRLQTVKRHILGVPFDLWSPDEGSPASSPRLTGEVIGFDVNELRMIARDAIAEAIDRRIATCRESMKRFGVTLTGEEPTGELAESDHRG